MVSTHFRWLESKLDQCRANGYRNQARGFDPRSGEGVQRFGGRFNPPNSFAVLYLCTTRPCVVAELTRQAKRQQLDVEQLLPRELWRVQTQLTRVLDLTDTKTLIVLNLNDADLVHDDHQLTREIGEAAYQHEFQAILTQSATGVDNVLAVLPDNLAASAMEARLLEDWTTQKDLNSDRRWTKQE